MNLNLHGLRPWEAPNNAVLAACALRHKDKLINWKAASTGKPWFAPDLIHLSPTGAGAYAALVRGSALSLSEHTMGRWVPSAPTPRRPWPLG